MMEEIWTYVHSVSKSEAEIEAHKIKDIPFHIVSLRSTWKRLKKKKHKGIWMKINGNALALHQQ